MFDGETLMKAFQEGQIAEVGPDVFEHENRSTLNWPR